MSKFHLYHISFFDSLIKGLESNGVSLDKYTRQNHIKRFDLNNPNTYLPLEVSYEFLNRIKYAQGIDSISGEFYGGFEVEDLSEYGQYLSSCPDLYSILTKAIKYDYLIQTHGKLTLKTEGAISWFSMKHMDPPSKGRLISERINLAMIIKAFQLTLGSDWTPIEINITSKNGYWLKKLMPSFDFKLNTNCAEIAICFKTSELTSKNKYHKESHGFESIDVQSMEGATRRILNSMKGSYAPTVDEFSEYFGYSKRTVLRKFAASGISYKSLLEKHLFLWAIEFLSVPNLSIEEISSILGYAHPSNFIRAFKRWTSATPYQYRLQEMNL